MKIEIKRELLWKIWRIITVVPVELRDNKWEETMLEVKRILNDTRPPKE